MTVSYSKPKVQIEAEAIKNMFANIQPFATIHHEQPTEITQSTSCSLTKEETNPNDDLTLKIHLPPSFAEDDITGLSFEAKYRACDAPGNDWYHVQLTQTTEIEEPGEDQEPVQVVVFIGVITSSEHPGGLYDLSVTVNGNEIVNRPKVMRINFTMESLG